MSIVGTVICTSARMKGSANMLCEVVVSGKKLFLSGSHVQLTEDMNDPYTPLSKGLKGVVRMWMI